MSARTRGYAQRIDIHAPVARVWEALTVEQHLRTWMGDDARVRPRAGGSLRVTPAPGLVRDALIDILDPPRRLRLIYLPPEGFTEAQAVVVDDYLLEEDGPVTILRLLGSGLPDLPGWDGYYRKVRSAQERALARLKVMAERQQARIMTGKGPVAR